MNKGTWVGLLLALLLIGGGAYLYWNKPREAPKPSVVPAAPVDDAAFEAAPEVEYPIADAGAEPGDTPLPALAESDAAISERLGSLFGAEPIEALLVPERVVRHFVTTVDSLDRDPVRPKLRPLRVVEGSLLVEPDGDGWQLSPGNAQRYDRYVDALAAVDAEALAAAYQRYYPLFQKAYEELGYPDRYFNDRMVAIIDHLLATPEVKLPVALVRPKVFYEFADPALERLSWGQKALIRMGPEHAATVKMKLTELRSRIVRRDGEP